MTFLGWFVVFNKLIPTNIYGHFELFYVPKQKNTLVEGLVLCPTDNFRKSFELGEHGIGGGSPLKRTRVKIVVRDECFDFLHKLFHALK